MDAHSHRKYEQPFCSRYPCRGEKRHRDYRDISLDDSTNSAGGCNRRHLLLHQNIQTDWRHRDKWAVNKWRLFGHSGGIQRAKYRQFHQLQAVLLERLPVGVVGWAELADWRQACYLSARPGISQRRPLFAPNSNRGRYHPRQ